MYVSFLYSEYVYNMAALAESARPQRGRGATQGSDPQHKRGKTRDRDRETERERSLSPSLSLSLYIYICVYRERERDIMYLSICISLSDARGARPRRSRAWPGRGWPRRRAGCSNT